jgi:plasmid stabilization system protein ParE
MTYRLTVSTAAQQDIREFLEWLNDYSPKIAAEHDRDLHDAIRSLILPRPHTWPYFFVTGSPYRAYLYSVSRRTTYWLVYTINEDEKIVNVLRFWNSARNPKQFVVPS